MGAIKNIIFDVGDVLLEYRWKDMLMDYGLSEDEAIKVGRLMFDDPLWTEMDLVDRSQEPRIISQYMEKYPEYADTISWFINHPEYMHVTREDVWERVHQIKQLGFHLYLLSNYPENMFEKHARHAAFLVDMDGEVVSYQVNKVKPDPEIYQCLLEKYKLQPQECLFFDDRPQNTEAAEKLGITAITVVSKDFLLEKLDEIIKIGKMPFDPKEMK